jgi:hypothetical protein
MGLVDGIKNDVLGERLKGIDAVDLNDFHLLCRSVNVNAHVKIRFFVGNINSLKKKE